MTSCHYYFVIQKWIRSSYQYLESTEISGSDSAIDNFGKGNRPLLFGNMFDGSAVTFSRFRGSGNVRQTAATRQTILSERRSTVATICAIHNHVHVWWHACLFDINHARQFELVLLLDLHVSFAWRFQTWYRIATPKSTWKYTVVYLHVGVCMSIWWTCNPRLSTILVKVIDRYRSATCLMDRL